MRKLIIGAAVATAVAALSSSPVDAGPPLDVTFEVPTTISEEGPTFGPFTASGAAVDAGDMCPSGDTIDLFGRASGGTPRGVNIQVVKIFTCDDGSGSFIVKLQVRIDRKGDNFQWVVLDGDGAYERLHGVGSGFGFPIPDGVFDVYQGQLHID